MDFEGQMLAVPIDVDTSKFRGVIKMNVTAARIFELLKEDRTEEEVVRIIADEFNVKEDLAQKDVRRCIDEYRSRGLIEE